MRLSIFILSDINGYVCSTQEILFDYDIEGENTLNTIGRDYMLPIYLDIVDEAKKVINKNIWYMFELLEANCAELSYEEVLSDIFPKYIIETNFEKCVVIVKALHNMVEDNFDRDDLPSFYELALYKTISWWIDVAKDILLDEIPRNLCINKQGMDMHDYLNNVDNYLDFMFQDWDFLAVEEMYSIYKRDPKVLDDFLHIDIEQYIELMPTDIQEEHNIQRERKLRDMDKRNITVNISGGQINIAKDNATINAIQNNGIDGNELETIIQTIKENLFGLKKDDVDGILDVLEQIKEEMDKSEPKKSRLQNCIKIIAPMITIANGIPVLATNLQKLQDFIIQYISNL